MLFIDSPNENELNSVLSNWHQPAPFQGLENVYESLPGHAQTLAKQDKLTTILQEVIYTTFRGQSNELT